MLKCDTSREVNSLQLANIAHIVVTFCVLKFDTSREVNALQLENIAPMEVTFWVLKCFRSREVKPEQPLNIPLMSVTFCVLEVRDVERSQARAIQEYRTHVGDVLGVEVRQVKRSQTGATVEHSRHVFHFRSVEILKSFNLSELNTFVEPIGSGCGTEISERGIEHHMRGDTVCHFPCSCPCREGVTSLFFSSP